MGENHTIVPLGDLDPERDRKFADDVRAKFKENTPNQSRHTRGFYLPALWDVNKDG